MDSERAKIPQNQIPIFRKLRHV